LQVGVKIAQPNWLEGVVSGWTVSGLPAGLKYSTKGLIGVTGTPTKAGLYTITAKKKKGAYYETKKFRVLVRPKAVDASLFGSLGGKIDLAGVQIFDWNLMDDVSSVGGKVVKVTGLPPGLTFAASTTYKDKKKTEYIRKLHFQIFDPAGSFENDAVGDLTHGTKKKGGVADNSVDTVSLRKNIFGRKADGTALVNEKAQSVLEYVAYYLDNQTITASSGHVVSLKFNRDSNGRLNGFVTLSGGLGSGSAMLFYEGMGSTFRYLVARFKVGARAVEVRYQMYFNGTGESASIQSTYAPTATVWTD
jgi:hypothetical protein